MSKTIAQQDPGTTIAEIDPAPQIEQSILPATNPHLATVDASTEAIVDSERTEDLQTNYTKIRNEREYDPAASDERAASEYRHQALREMHSYVNQTRLDPEADSTALVEDAEMMLSHVEENTKRPDIYWRNVAEKAAGRELSEAEIDLFARDALVGKVLYDEVLAGTNYDGKWEFNDFGLSSLKNVGGLMFYRFAPELLEAGIEDLPTVIGNVQTLPPYEQALAIGSIIENLQEVGMNPLKVSIVTDMLLSPDGVEAAQNLEVDDALIMVDYIATAVSFGLARINTVRRLASVGRATGRVVSSTQRGNTAALTGELVEVSAKSTKALAAAATANVAAMKSEDIAHALGFTSTTAVDNATFWHNKELLNKASTDGLHNEILDEVAELSDDVEAFETKIREDLGSVNMLSPETAEKSTEHADKIVAAEERVYEVLRDKYEAAPADINITQTEVTTKDGQPALKIVGTVGSNKKQRSQKTVRLGTTEDGTHGAVVEDFDVATSGSTWFSSPRKLFESLTGKNTLVRDATLVSINEHRIASELSDLFGQVFAPLKGNKKSFKKVQAVIRKYDQLGRRPTPRELRDGIETEAGTLRLSLAEQRAFYRYASFQDTMLFISRTVEHQQLVKEGYKRIKLGEHIDRPGKVVPANKVAELTNRKDFRVLDEDGRPTNFEDVDMEGKVLVQLREKYGKVGGEQNSYAVVRSDSISSLQLQPGKRQGFYEPLIRRGTQFVIREHRAGKVDGELISINKAWGNDLHKGTVASASSRVVEGGLHGSRSDALEELKRLNAEHADDDSVVYVLTSEQDPRFSGKDPINVDKGIGSASRSSQDFLEGVSDAAPERLPFAEGMQRYINSISRDVALSEWRAEQITKMENTVRKATGNDRWSFTDEIPKNASKELKNLHSYLHNILRVQNGEERAWESLNYRVGNFLDGVGAKKTGHYINSVLAQADPVMKIRAINYNTMLGLWNMSQIAVQASGAVISMTLHPVAAAKVLPDYFAFSLLMRTPVIKNMRADLMNRLIKKGGLGSNFAERFKRFERSGIYNTVEINPDMVALNAGLPIDGASFKRLINSGSMFVRLGERFNQTMSWLVADELARTGKIAKGLKGDELEREILGKAFDMTLNISKANRAVYEEASFSALFSQFMGVQTKMMELWLPSWAGGRKDIKGGLNPLTNQKLRVLMGQMAIFGAAGFGLQEVAKSIYLSVTGKNPEDLSEDEINFLVGGMMRAAIPELAISDRTQLAVNFKDLYFKMMYGSDVSALNMIGATGTTFNRSFTFLKTFARVFTIEDDEGFFNEEQMKLAALDFARLTSSGNNALKWYVLNQENMIRQNSTGGSIYNYASDPEVIERRGTLLGFQTAQEKLTYDLATNLRKKQVIEQKLMKDVVRHMRDYHSFDEAGDIDAASASIHAAKYLVNLIAGGDPIKARDMIRDMYENKIDPEANPLMDKYLDKGFKDDSEEFADSLLGLQTRFAVEKRINQTPRLRGE